MRAQTLTQLFTTCWVLALSGVAAAQNEDAMSSQEELAKTVQNPLASLVSLPFQAN